MSIFTKFVSAAVKAGGIILGFRKGKTAEDVKDAIREGGPISGLYNLAMYSLTLENVKVTVSTAGTTPATQPLSNKDKHDALLPHARAYLAIHVFGDRKIGNKAAQEAAAGYLVNLVVAVMNALHPDELETED